jgi:hypothetical protein
MATRSGNGRVELAAGETVTKTLNRFGFPTGTGTVQIDGETVAVREMHDSTAPIETATWYVEVRKATRKDPLAGMTLLTTPEEDFGTSRSGSGEPE